MMLTKVRGHWNELVSFIDSFYQELTGVAKFPEGKAWELVGWCVAAFFETMHSNRARAAGIQDANTLESKALLLWTVLQGHRITALFASLGFRGHPAIVKEMSLFMLTQRVDPSEIPPISDKLTKVVTAASKSSADVSKLESSFATLKRSVNNLSNSLNQVKAKVK